MNGLGNWVKGLRNLEDHSSAPLPGNYTGISASQPVEFRSGFPTRQIVADAVVAASAGLLFASTGRVPAILIMGVMFAAWIGVVVWRLIRVGWAITLTREAVILRSRRTTVICPWALFDCDGTAHGDYFFDRILVPIREEYVDDIIRTRRSQVAGQGLRARCHQVAFPGSSKMLIRGNYGIDHTELAEYISRLAFRAAPHAQDSTVENSAVPVPPPTRAGSRWRTMDLSRMNIPPMCCSCLSPDCRWRKIESTSILAFLLHLPHKTISLQLPICRLCERRQIGRLLRWGAVGYIVGFLVIALLLYLDQRQLDWWTMLATAVLALGPAGLCLLIAFPFTVIVRLSRYSDRRQTVRIWVRNREFWSVPARTPMLVDDMQQE